MKQLLSVYLPAIAFIVSVILLLRFSDSIMILKELMGEGNVTGYTAYVLALTLATVAMPITVMPLIPVATMMFGPLATAVLSMIGWTLGGVLAFLVARYLGRPVLEKLTSLEKVDAFANKMPQDSRFLIIVLLRLTMPVDIVSYALGFSKAIGIVEYTLATLIGVSWFSFAFAYLGDAVYENNKLLLAGLGIISLSIFTCGWYFLHRVRQRNRD